MSRRLPDELSIGDLVRATGIGEATLRAWERLLAACGFRTNALPMSHGTPFVNVLLRAELA